MRIPLFLILFLSACASVFSQSIASTTVDQLYTRMRAGGDTTYVVNFWATWCKPCLEEMPFFLEAAGERKDKPFKLLLITLDFDNQIETRVKSFIEKNNVSEEILTLNEKDANEWIPRFNKDWTGSIPATMLFSKVERRFHEGKMEREELSEFLEGK